MDDVKQNDRDKIDMVYLWCDGNEKEFVERKESLKKSKNIIDKNPEVIGTIRFFDNDELKYSLRSLEMYAPWINHVYIVTDRQIPKWLNTSYEKVTVVDHSEIMPNNIIPCFNSAVIEYFLPFIPGLQENFLYGNDDMFFGNYVQPQDFFDNGKPIVRVEKHKGCIKEPGTYSSEEYSWRNAIFNSLNILKMTYGKNDFYVPHHNIDAYSKSLFIAALNRFRSHIETRFCNSFRSANDLERTLINLDMVYSGFAKLKIVQEPKPWRKRLNFIKKVDWESYCNKEDGRKTQKDIIKYKPKFFCINSSLSCTNDIKSDNKRFMEKLFPVKSQFEI